MQGDVDIATKIQGETISMIRYASDIAIMTERGAGLKAGRYRRKRIQYAKTKVIVCHKEGDPTVFIIMNGDPLEGFKTIKVPKKQSHQRWKKEKRNKIQDRARKNSSQ